ncbi:hypothetical protein AMC99_01205 [Altererythrobacter epoxidivorans]|uniref:Phytoene synthase n=1 Tax=Altererythrobacter epoxidivorans TaxID=361183 RepID=A0A0M4MVG4_9SPHN|nr:squalene/phytoene synthase family protein [Altererythrobacter epoxidivorans]ALE16500.1 hypothetical protein AMC99_01205 [Altererythrobacter epoxidivorans]
MDPIEQDISDEQRLALSYCAPKLRPMLVAGLALDRRLARIVATANEPMLAQMRLAWWRDTLLQPVASRPIGDVVLGAIGSSWEGHERSLLCLVDGWEGMIGSEIPPRESFASFANARAGIFEAVAEVSGSADASVVAEHAKLWALVDAAVNNGQQEEREILADLARGVIATGRVRREMRGVAVLSALARRSLDRGLRPLLEGRGAALTAMKAGLSGR